MMWDEIFLSSCHNFPRRRFWIPQRLIRFIMMSLRLALLAALLTGSSASMLVHPEGRALRELATRVANDVTARLSDNGERRLQTWDEDSFRDQVCDPFNQGFLSTAPSGSECQCKASSFSIVCEAPQSCDQIDGCAADVCGTTSILVDYTEIGTSLVVTSIGLQSEYTGGTDYQGQRALVTETACQQWFTFSDGLEYECLTCELCAGDDGGVNLDCSNIQPGAVDNTCLDTTGITTDTTVFFDFCQPGGAPKPTTTGTTPVDLFSGCAANFLAVTAALAPAAAFFLL
jgi:hypothetical protein